MANSFTAWLRRRIYQHRARWAVRQMMPYIKAGDQVLDVGAGDCRMDVRLQDKTGCRVVPVDVEDFNQTELKLTLFDGQTLPFPDDSFDAVLLIFVLHHATDAKAVLAEARRVSRHRVIVFEDVVSGVWDRFVFRVFHRWLAWSEKISYPFHELRPQQWQDMARSLQLHEHWSGFLGRSLGIASCRHIAFVWQKEQAPVAKAARE